MKKALAGLLLALVLPWGLDRAFPLPEPKAMGQVVTDRQGRPLRSFADDEGVWRYPVSPEQVAPVYLELLLAYEDRWFHHHPGINPLAMARAAWQNLSSGRIVSGGSTLTMQVARLLDPHDRTLAGKLKQVLRALQLEWHLDKEQILGLYLDLAPFGGTLSGVQAASYSYFGKDAGELSDAEAALLAVLPQRPSALRPDRHPQRARQARDKVLDRMLALGLWPSERVEAAKLEPVVTLNLRPRIHAPLLARRLREQCPGCRRIPTTLDGDLQRQLEAMLRDHIRARPANSSAAILVVDNSDMAVLAYLGSADFADPGRFGHVDMVGAMRSPGSTLKPFLFGRALDAGLIHSASLLADIPRHQDSYRPGNFGGGFSGPVSAARALQQSLNLPAVQLLEHYGPARLAANLRNAGLPLTGPGAVRPNLSLILGGVGSNLEGLVSLYSALANRGQAGVLRFRPDDPGKQRYLMSPGAAWITWDTLRQPEDRQLAHFSGRRWPLAWKTGTSYGFRDAWAIGVSPSWTIGVWTGRPDGSPSPGQHGRADAAPLLFQVYERLGNSQQEKPLPRPGNVSRAEICWPLGTRGEDRANGEGNCLQRLDAWLLDGNTPRTLSLQTEGIPQPNPLPIWVDANGQRLLAGCPGRRQRRFQALWPNALEPWLPARWRRQVLLPPLAKDCDGLAKQAPPLRILGVDNELLLQQAGPNAPMPSLSLRFQGGSGRGHWYINGQAIGASPANGQLLWQFEHPGRYQLTLVDEAGNLDMKTIRIAAWRS
ncbi:penicillin-binding protein 1C [Gallaecimonas sp. GXIMD4217]|uniref:penicillin-binding protein 1C n=1 Tax=Gallaecimonas sp. GXIMD4217 TaxID=3131927 RepID=UPI00311AEB7A